jgi:hypothetical protein
MRTVPNAAERIVATMEGPLGIPADSRIAGLTMMMYDIARKVVIPANVSFL